MQPNVNLTPPQMDFLAVLAEAYVPASPKSSSGSTAAVNDSGGSGGSSSGIGGSSSGSGGRSSEPPAPPPSQAAYDPLSWPSYSSVADLKGLPPHCISVNELDPGAPCSYR
jgi:hypothetical protein